MDEDAGRDGASSKMNTMDGDGMEREETIGEKSVEGSGSREVGYFTTATGKIRIHLRILHICSDLYVQDMV